MTNRVYPRFVLVVAILAFGWVARDAIASRPPASVAIGFVGDSITRGYGLPASPADLAVSSLPIHPAVAVDMAAIGATTLDWRPGGPLYRRAVVAFDAAHVHIVHVMLGTNDARLPNAVPPARYGARLVAIAHALVRDGFTVVLAAPPYAAPSAPDGLIDAAVDARLLAYQAQIQGIADGGMIRLGDTGAYAAFAAHPTWTYDGIHPTMAGAHWLARAWAASLADALTPQAG